MGVTIVKKICRKSKQILLKVGRYFPLFFYLFPMVRKLLRQKHVVIFFDAGDTIGDPLQLFSVASVFHRSSPSALLFIILPQKKERILRFFAPIGTPIFYKNGLTKFFMCGANLIINFEYSPKRINRFFSDIWFLKTPIVNDANAIDFLAIRRLHLPVSWIPELPKPPRLLPPFCSKKGRGIVLINKNSGLSNEQIIDSISLAAEYCKSQGFTVVCNVSGSEKTIAGLQPISCSLSELYWFAKEKAALFISVRSGLLDFLISAGCPIISIDSNPPVYSQTMPLSMWKTATRYWSIPYTELTSGFLQDRFKELNL